MPVTQVDKGRAFQSLHQGPHPFIIANAWDAGSARVLTGLGFTALATSTWASAGVYGRLDYATSRDELMVHAQEIVNATELPVSMDLGNGFGATPEEIKKIYGDAAAIGLVGASIEDVRSRTDDANPLFDIAEAAERVAAAVEATRSLDAPFVITARADGFLTGAADLDKVILRLQAYETAGADVLMAPGLPDLDAVRRVCSEITKPFSFMAALPGISFSVTELEQAGVRRISLGPAFYLAAMAGLASAARQVKEEGSFAFIEAPGLSYPELVSFMRQ